MQAAVWLSLAAGVGLVVIELARSVPAWLRVRRRRNLAGVSPISTGVLAGSATGWMAVAVFSSAWPALVAATVWLGFHLLLSGRRRLSYRRLGPAGSRRRPPPR